MVYKMTETISSFNVKNRKSVISAIVQTQYYDMSTCRIITIASGTKNIDGDHISQSTVNDTHAEIVARRCFMKYLNDQLVLAMDKSMYNNNIKMKMIFNFIIKKKTKNLFYQKQMENKILFSLNNQMILHHILNYEME